MSKKILALTLTGALTLTNAETTAAKDEPNTVYYTVEPTVTAIGNVRLRALPSTSSAILGVFPVNSTAKLLGEESGFYEINFNGIHAYVSKEYVRNSDHVNMPAQYSKKVTTYDDAKVYQDFNYNKQIGTIPKNTEVEVYAEDGIFYFVKYYDLVGCIEKRLTYNYRDDNKKKERKRFENNNHYNNWDQPMFPPQNNWNQPSQQNNYYYYYDYSQNNYYQSIEGPERIRKK